MNPHLAADRSKSENSASQAPAEASDAVGDNENVSSSKFSYPNRMPNPDSIKATSVASTNTEQVSGDEDVTQLVSEQDHQSEIRDKPEDEPVRCPPAGQTLGRDELESNRDDDADSSSNIDNAKAAAESPKPVADSLVRSPNNVPCGEDANGEAGSEDAVHQPAVRGSSPIVNADDACNTPPGEAVPRSEGCAGNLEEGNETALGGGESPPPCRSEKDKLAACVAVQGGVRVEGGLVVDAAVEKPCHNRVRPKSDAETQTDQAGRCRPESLDRGGRWEMRSPTQSAPH